MATYLELQTRVQQIVIDLPTAVTAQVPTLIKESVRRLQRLHDFKVCETLTSVLTTVEGTRTLAAVPADFYKFRRLPHLIHATGRTQDLGLFPDRGSAEREYGTLAGGEATAADLSGSPRFLMLSENTDENGTMNFEVFPLPDGNSTYANGEYRIRVPYYKFLTELAASGSSNWFTTHAEEWLAWDAAGEAFFLNWDENRGALWKQKAASKYKEVIDADKRLRYSGFDTLQPSLGALPVRGIFGDNASGYFNP